MKNAAASGSLPHLPPNGRSRNSSRNADLSGLKLSIHGSRAISSTLNFLELDLDFEKVGLGILQVEVVIQLDGSERI